MPSVDNRIVSMEMRNEQFEKNARNSLKTIESLDTSLKTLSSAKGLDNINVGSVSGGFSAISDGVEAISSRFSMLGQIAATVLSNIVTDAYNAGKQLVSAFTIDPIKSGFAEYQTQINATQTILANTSREGTSLDQVNAALDELNHYADKTIYNFTEMTRNIGTFTAAGVDLDTSVAAIKGIANLAAVSGSDSNQASRAMYQLSQALAAGVVNLQDWNSVVNAGMGGAIFQDALKETARAMGIVVDESQSFRESLSKETGSGWLTSEVLLETLRKFTGDMTEAELAAKGYTDEQIKSIIQMGETANNAATKVKTVTQLFDTLKEAAQSGWTQSWQIIIGDFEEAKNMLTAVSDTFGDMINSSSEARNAVLKDWKDLGGRNDLMESFKNIFEAIQSVVLPLKGAFNDIFPPATGKTLADLTAKLKTFTAGLKLSYVQSNQLRRAFSGVFAIFDIGKQAFLALANAMKPLFSAFESLRGSALKNAASLGDYFVSLRDSLAETDYFNKKIEELKNFGEKLKEAAHAIYWAFLTFYEAVDSKGLKVVRESFNNFYKIVTEKIKGIFSGSKELSPLMENLRQFFTNILSIINKGLTAIKPIADKVGEVLGSIAKSIYETFKNPNLEAAQGIANNVLVGGVILAVKKFVDILNTISKEGLSGLKKVNETFKGSLDSIKAIFSGVEDALKSWQDSLKAGTLLKIAGAIAILAASLAVLASLDTEKLGTGLVAISTMFIELNATLAIFSKLTDDIKGFGSTTAILIGVSAAILILSSAIKKLSTVNPIDVVKGLSAITILLGELIIVSKLMNSSTKGLTKTSIGLVVLAVAVKGFVSALSAFSTIDPQTIVKGLLGVGAIFVELAAFLKVADLKKIGLLKATGILILAQALKVFSAAVYSFGSIDPGTLIMGLAGIAAALGEVGVFTRIIDTKGIFKTSVSMTILGASLLIFANAVTKFGNLSWEQLAIGLSGMAGSLGMVAIALNVMPKNTVGLSVGLIAVGAALNIIASAMTSMGSLSWEQLGVSLVAMAGSLTILGVALTAIKASLKDAAVLVVGAAAITVIANAFALLGTLSLQQVGIGLLAIAGGLGLFVAAAYAVKPAADALNSLGTILIGLGAILAGMAALLAAITFDSFANGVTGGVTQIAGALAGSVIAAAIAAFVDSFATMFMTILETFRDSQVLMVEAAYAILSALLEAVGGVAPQLIKVVVELITTLLVELASHMPDIVKAGFDIIMSLLKGIADNIGKITEAAIEIMVNFLDAISNKMDDLMDAGARLVISFINGVADGIREHTPELIKAVANLGQSIVDGLAQAIYDGITYVVRAAMDLAGSVWDSIKDFFDINSPSKKTYWIGDQLDLGMAQGVSKNASKVTDAAEDMGGSVMEALNDAFTSLPSLTEADLNSNPVITPVLDLSNIQAGASQIDSLMGQNRTLAFNGMNMSNVLGNLSSISGYMAPKATTPVPVQTQNNDSKLTETLNKLETRITQLGDAITHIQVVMDTGALVGEIAGPMDRALGWKTTLRNRGV